MTEWQTVRDIVSLEEAWALFPLAMQRANLGIGHLMSRPGFRLRLWDDDRSLLAQAESTPLERERHVTRSMRRNRSRPLTIAGVTHRMERRSEKAVQSACGMRMGTRQAWDEARGKVVDCMACLTAKPSPWTARGEKTREELENLQWTACAKWMPNPGVWSRYGASFASHPRREPRKYEGETPLEVVAGD